MDTDVHTLVESEWGSKFIHGSAAHPQTQGVVERPNKTIKAGLDYEICRNGGGVRENLDLVRTTYNNRRHSTIKMTPSVAFHSTKILHPMYNRSNITATDLGKASIIADAIYKAAKLRAERNQRTHDKRKDPSRMLKVGDTVFHQKSRKDGLKRLRGKNLASHHYRGEVIERALNNTIKIKWNSDCGGPDGE